MDLAGVTLVTFDCFGTLIDWEMGILRAVRPLLPRTFPDEQVLALYAKIEREVEGEAYRSYREVLAEVMRRIGRDLGRAVGPGDAKQLAGSLATWAPFGEVPAMLAAIKARAKVGVISNVDHDLFEPIAAKLGVELDLLVTAEDVRAYKPSEAPFRRAMELAGKMGIKPGAMLHAAESRFHDIEPASRLGLKTAWVNRGRGRPGATPVVAAKADLEVRNLRELAAALGAA